MTDLRKAAEMALEALEHAQDCVRTNYHPGHYWEKEIEALCQALVHPEQEGMKIDASAPLVVHPHPAFAAPLKREWVGLTDEEKAWCGAPTLQETVARVEAKLKEKNT